jgi:hypothetical protein
VSRDGRAEPLLRGQRGVYMRPTRRAVPTGPHQTGEARDAAVSRSGRGYAVLAHRRPRLPRPGQLGGLRRRLARRGRGRPARGREARRGGARPAQPHGRRRGLSPRGRRHGAHAERIQGRLRHIRQRRLDGPVGARGLWRPGAAPHPQHGDPGICLGREPRLRHVSRPDAGRDGGPAGPRLGGAEGAVPAQDGRGRVDRHHEPDRAALRHGSRPAQDQGRAERRRLLQHHRHQDLHLGRRARSRREHRAPRHRPDRGGARRHQGHLALRGAEITRERRRVPRGAQRRVLRFPRAQDGHPRQRHLRDEL